MENGRYLLDLSMQSGARPVYSEEELAVVTGKLWGLLSRLAESYTGSASSSLRAETAQALLQSACFLLSLSLKDGADPTALVGRLCDEDYDKLFQRGLGEATARLEAGKELLSKARETMLRVNNTAIPVRSGSSAAFSTATITIISRTRYLPARLSAGSPCR
jgi:hypothetical protein